MRRMLTLALGLHWMSVYAVLAIVCVAEPREGLAGALDLLGAETEGLWLAGGHGAAAFFATIFALAAVFFFLALLDVVFSQTHRQRLLDIHYAFGAGVLSQTLLLCAGAFHSVPGVLLGVEAMLAASLASYVAMQVEWRVRPRSHAQPDGVRSTARVMALGAAHTSLLQRLPAGLEPERRP